jgi:hypothetical protein
LSQNATEPHAQRNRTWNSGVSPQAAGWTSPGKFKYINKVV